MLQKTIEYVKEKHGEINHMYDVGKPYFHHLEMVNDVAREFIHLIPIEDQINVLCGRFRISVVMQ